jgi:serine/threonine-protein kinase HipA
MAERTAIVTFKAQPAGLLVETGNGSRFSYNDGWTQPIACALPAETRDHYWQSGLIPFFEHLGSEGWLRGLQARAGGTADQDDLGLLLNYGADCIGAVGILPQDGTTVQPFLEPDIAAEAAIAPGRTLSGVQKKLLAFRADAGFQPSSGPADPATHIVKFNRDDVPTLVQNEALSLKLAREVLGDTEVTKAAHGVVQGFDGIVLIVERFDRAGDEKLRLEDFAQILNKPRGRDFKGKYRSSYEEAAAVIDKFSARARLDLDRYFRLLVFNLVIGNADAHLKNFSLLERPEGLRLSPAYDLLNTLLYPYDRLTALEIGGRRREFDSLDRGLVQRLGTSIGLPAKAVALALDQLAQRFARAEALKLAAHVQPADFRAKYRDIVVEHAQRILT